MFRPIGGVALRPLAERNSAHVEIRPLGLTITAAGARSWRARPV